MTTAKEVVLTADQNQSQSRNLNQYLMLLALSHVMTEKRSFQMIAETVMTALNVIGIGTVIVVAVVVETVVVVIDVVVETVS